MQSFPIRKIVVTAVLSAISVVLFLTPLGYPPPIAGASMTLMHLPVIIGAVLEGPIVGLIVGFLFGLTSLIKAAVAPQGPIDPFFVNPLISILPRLAIGPIAWLVYRALKKRIRVEGLILAGIAGSLTNTVLVLGSLGLFVVGSLEWFTWALIGTIVVTNGFLEAAVAAVVTLAVVGTRLQIEYGRRGSRLEPDDSADSAKEQPAAVEGTPHAAGD